MHVYLKVTVTRVVNVLVCFTMIYDHSNIYIIFIFLDVKTTNIFIFNLIYNCKILHCKKYKAWILNGVNYMIRYENLEYIVLFPKINVITQAQYKE